MSRDAGCARALRLALGTPAADDAGDGWELVLGVASRELLAPLAWARSAAFIRAHAPAAVVEAWRRHGVAADLHGRTQLADIVRVSAVLTGAGIRPIVLKGIPLSVRLYGSGFVRCTADIDLYVPAGARDSAGVVLEGSGWRRAAGRPPWHEAWVWDTDGAARHLEVHSSLVCDHLAHLPVGAPEWSRVEVDGTSLAAHDGPLVAAHLAAHLATHQMAPLLWLVDFHTLWQRYSSAERAVATDAARRSGLDRYLMWACERAGWLVTAAAGEGRGLAALGVHGARRADAHSIWRHVALAPTWDARARVLLSCLAPRPERTSAGSLAKATLRRVRQRGTALIGVRRWYAPADPARSGPGTTWRGPRAGAPSSARPLRVERAELLSLVREVIASGNAVWVRAPGGSMAPTIARGALVRIGPLPARPVRAGEVVLALTAEGEPVIHRVVRSSGGHLILRGDSALAEDPPVTVDRVVALASHVRDGRGERAMPPAHRPGASLLRWRRRVARWRVRAR